ncbi:AAA family ATPase [Kaarinaea lacus]
MAVLAEINQSHNVYQRIFTNISSVIRGKDDALRKLLAAFFTGQHVLLEDVPGTGKTTLAKALAASVSSEFQRIQFTPDLLPSDIVGVSIYNQKEQNFSFHHGPIFTHILLADEINRASPRTQSALLEAMAEKQVSVDGERYTLDDIFFVIATQNPVESHGTYPLPEAQMDRFGLQFSLGYVTPEEEMQMLTEQGNHHPLDDIQPCAERDDVLSMRATIKSVHVSEEIKRYMVDLVGATREATGIKIGASFRASLTLMQTAQALAVFDGQDFVAPDQVQEIAVSVLAHRLSLDPQSRFNGRDGIAIIKDILQVTPVPD